VPAGTNSGISSSFGIPVDIEPAPEILLIIKQLGGGFVIYDLKVQASPPHEEGVHPFGVVVTGDFDLDAIGALLAANHRLGDAETVDPVIQDLQRQVDGFGQFSFAGGPAQALFQALGIGLENDIDTAAEVQTEVYDPAFAIFQIEDALPVVFLQAPGGFVLTAEGRQDIADGPITRTVDIQQPVQIPCYGDAVAQLFGDCRIRIGGQQYPKVAGGLSLGVTADFFPGAAGNGLNVLGNHEIPVHRRIKEQSSNCDYQEQQDKSNSFAHNTVLQMKTFKHRKTTARFDPSAAHWKGSALFGFAFFFSFFFSFLFCRLCRRS
jgi:hypothetical protein